MWFCGLDLYNRLWIIQGPLRGSIRCTAWSMYGYHATLHGLVKLSRPFLDFPIEPLRPWFLSPWEFIQFIARFNFRWLQTRFHECIVAHISWAPYRTKSVLETKFRALDSQKTRSMVVNETWKVITDNQFLNSCCREVSDHQVAFGSAREPTKHNALWHGRLKPKHGAPAVWTQLSTRLSFALIWSSNLMRKQ